MRNWSKKEATQTIQKIEIWVDGRCRLVVGTMEEALGEVGLLVSSVYCGDVDNADVEIKFRVG